MGFWEKFREKKKSGAFGKAKTKGKAKRDNFWWEDQEDYYNKYGGGGYSYGAQGEITGWDGGGGYSRKTEFSSGYTYSYKQPFDMSVSLESRIKGLIQTITGQSKQLLVADGWGIDQNNIYYNPSDIDGNATDDRVLGQILHQLSVALYYDQRKANGVMRREPPYKHLLLALEHNRVDRQLQHFYFGCKYYAESFWQEAGKEALKPDDRNRFYDGDRYTADVKSLADVPASQFNYAIHSHSNGEKTFDIVDKKTAKNFEKARPLIDQYLDEPDFMEAVKIYEQIKKYYPVPSKEAQEQMDRSHTGQAVSAQGKRRAVAKASQGKQLLDGEGESNENEAGKRGGFYDTKIENPTRDQATYWNAHAKHLGAINSLHQLLKSIIADNEAHKFMRPFKRGKLDKKRIYKYLAVDNRRIFKQRKDIDKKKYGMVIMVDQSGSMSGELSRYAMESTVVLTEVFNRLDLPFAIMGFSDNTYLYKGFNQSVPRETVCAIQRTYGGTNDLGALQKVEKQLEAVFQHQRTGVFVITDGCGYSQEAMRSQVERIESKNAKVFGIGIGGVYKEDLDRSYVKNVSVPEIAGLPRELGNLLKGQFRRQ